MSGEKHKFSSYHIAVLIPCINEETTIGKVVKDFKQLLPAAKMYVYDNNSTDRTKERAIQAGAIVRSETLKGKGNVIRRMFADIEADVYVLVNGDDTYHAASVIDMIELLVRNQLDMVNGARSFEKSEVFRSGHRLGNRILSNLVRIIFGKDIKDMLSGFRVFSHRFVKSFTAMSRGFEIETELTIHALELRLKVAEIETPFKM
jgi:glycosyltransferase involved in cell wall biosynthesis